MTNSVDIACAGSVLHQPADWYFPAGRPRGLVLLVHGFGASKDLYRDLANRLTGAGAVVFAPDLPAMDPRGCALSSLLPNRAFLDNVADLFGTAADPGGALQRSFRDARERAGRPDVVLPENLVLSGHSAGGGVVLHLAQRLATAHPAGFARLRGVLALDPVRGIDTSVTEDALRALATTDLPMLTIATPPSLCNNGADATESMQRHLPRRFLGVRVLTGSHVDALGTDLGAIGEIAGIMCGTIRLGNSTATRDLTVAWTLDLLDGTRTDDYHPGGAYYEMLRDTGVIQTITGAAR
ncbi:alpha/beta hydrolase [Nocardia sp. XZ_19_385]|uniref:alpha/beta hydrolase n=1 Tax=Nocardia sp. XZ_19_385 TaxID=2769488 RepID=UPI00188E9EF6|nr:alpha/beta fold hydrolase [Nocardia sp. XZ_19_385]